MNKKQNDAGRDFVSRFSGLKDGDSTIHQRQGYNEVRQILNFSDWADAAREAKQPHAIRRILYDVTQPLYDALVNSDTLNDSNRQHALNAFNVVARNSVAFLTDFYKGRPKLKVLSDLIEEVSPEMQSLNSASYYRKYRNLDRDLSTNNVATFFMELKEYFKTGDLDVPHYILGCACGASEIAFAFAGITELPYGLIRKSKRREDPIPLLIPEQENAIKAGVEGKIVLCFEDMVCTGRSLLAVMKKASSFGAKHVFGAAPYTNSSYTRESDLRKIREDNGVYGGLNLYKLK